MTDRDVHVATLLDEAVPSAPVGPDRWEAVVHEAGAGDRPAARRWLAAGVPAALAVAAAVLVVVLVWPFGGRGGGTVLERALAAVGDGPVLHVVFQEGWHGTRVDLATGRRTEIHGEREAWYDPARGVHEVSRFDGVLQSDVIYPPDRLPAVVEQPYAGLLDGYRGALRSGSVRGEPGEVDGIPVYWLEVHRQLLPDVADGKLHEFAQELAVSRETFQPVATRDARDGVPGPDGASRIVRLESLPAGDGDFVRQPGGLEDGTPMKQTSDPVTAPQAATVMDAPAVWLGDSFSGLPVSQLERTDTSIGQVRHAGVRVSYGAPTVGGRAVEPAGRYVTLEETTELYPGFGRGATGYAPPEGSVVLFGGRIGLLRAHGVDVHIEASSESLLLEAARALRPVA